MSICINQTHPEYLVLKEKTNFSTPILNAKIGVWQDTYKTEEFPTYEELVNNTFKTKDSLSSDQKENIQNLKQSDPRWNKYNDEDIQRFIDSVFPDSKVKDILHTITTTDNKKSILKSNRFLKPGEEGYKKRDYATTEGIYFTDNNSYDEETEMFGSPISGGYGSAFVSALLNIKNPLIDLTKGFGDVTKTDKKNHDGFIGTNESKEIVVFEPEQIYILSSDQAIFDIDKFVGGERQYQLNDKQNIEKNIKELDEYLLNFLKQFGVKSKEFEELKSKLGIDALGATDVINKLIWFTKNRNEETIPEESAHIIVMLMGEEHPMIKELIVEIVNWDNYSEIYNNYINIYNNEKQVKIEAIGKLIAKSFVKNYKIAGVNKTLLQKLLDVITEYLDRLLNNLNIFEAMQHNQKLADHITINILSGNKNYIKEILNKENKLDYNKALNSNLFAKSIIERYTKLGAKLTGSLAIAGQGEDIYRNSQEPIHDIDFNVNSFEDYNKLIPELEKQNAVPMHFGWDNAQKDYKTFAFIIPKKGYNIEVLNRDMERGNGWITEYNLLDENNNIVIKTSKNHLAVDFFVYKHNNIKDNSIFKSYVDIYKGKLTLSRLGNNERFFQREKDQEDYILSRPKSILPSGLEFKYFQLNTNKPDLNLKQKYFKDGNITNTKTMLEKIAKNNAKLSPIAKHLLKYTSINNSEVELVKPEELEVYDYNRVLGGLYDYNLNKIFISDGIVQPKGESETVILHEILHSLSYEYLRKDSAVLDDFNTMFTHAKSIINKDLYGLTNIDEFFTALFTDARLIDELKSVPPIEIGKYENFLKEIFDYILSLFGVKEKNTFYNQAFSIATNVLESQYQEKESEKINDQVINDFEETPELVLSGSALEYQDYLETNEITSPEDFSEKMETKAHIKDYLELSEEDSIFVSDISNINLTC